MADKFGTDDLDALIYGDDDPEPHVIAYCPGCGCHQALNRVQVADTDGGTVEIVTQYTCLSCSSQFETRQTYGEANEAPDGSGS